MASLAELPELVGFFSYSRSDDEHSGLALSQLRGRIYNELRLQLGRRVRLWQDTTAIPHGTLWEQEIRRAIGESSFFIPIVTPSAVSSPQCKFEFEAFLKRESELLRNDLVFPILYIRIPALMDEQRRHDDVVLDTIHARQYADWTKIRQDDVNSSNVGKQIERLCEDIVDALCKSWEPPQQNRPKEDSESRHRTQQEEPGAIVAHVVGSGATSSSETSLLVPNGWFTSGSKPEQYDMGVDTQIAGSPAMIRCKYADDDPVYVAMEKGFGTLMQSILADEYRGTRLRLRAELKTDNVTGAGTIWMRVDGPGGTLQFDNMEKRKTLGVLKGTVDWVPREIILDVPEEAESINFGFFQHGTGATWARNFVLEQVGRDVPLTTRMNYLDKATNLNFSFSNTRPSPQGEDSSPLGKKPSGLDQKS
jgi:TIR domain